MNKEELHPYLRRALLFLEGGDLANADDYCEKYLDENDLFVTCVFGEEIDGKVVQKGTLAKMARGEMVRFLAENEIDSLEGVKNFHGLGYEFSEELFGEKEYIFIKKA